MCMGTGAPCSLQLAMPLLHTEVFPAEGLLLVLRCPQWRVWRGRGCPPSSHPGLDHVEDFSNPQLSSCSSWVGVALCPGDHVAVSVRPMLVSTCCSAPRMGVDLHFAMSSVLVLSFSAFRAAAHACRGSPPLPFLFFLATPIS